MPILFGYHPVQEGCVANTCNTGWRLLSKPWARQTAQATELTCLEAVLSQGGAGGCWLSTKPHSRCGSVIPGQKSHSSLAHSLSCLTSSPLLPVCSGMVSIWTACTQILSQSLFLGIGKPRDQKKKKWSQRAGLSCYEGTKWHLATYLVNTSVTPVFWMCSSLSFLSKTWGQEALGFFHSLLHAHEILKLNLNRVRYSSHHSSDFFLSTEPSTSSYTTLGMGWIVHGVGLTWCTVHQVGLGDWPVSRTLALISPDLLCLFIFLLKCDLLTVKCNHFLVLLLLLCFPNKFYCGL